VDDPFLPEIIETGLTAPTEALARARAATANLSPTTPLRLRAHTALALGFALNRAERFDEALPALTEADAVLRSLGLTHELALCHWQMGVAARFLRTDPHFAQTLEVALNELLTTEQETDAARCRRDLAAAYNWKGRYDDSAAQTAQARAFFESKNLKAEAATCAFAESARLRWAGNFAAALDTLTQAEATFTESGLPVEEATAWLYKGSVYAASMEFAPALDCLRRAEARLERLDLPMRLALCRTEMGIVALTQGRLRDAEQWHRFAAESFRSLSMRGDFAMAMMNLANVRFYQGELDDARALYNNAQAEFKAVGNRLYETLCELNTGVVESASSRYGSALRHLERARANMLALGATDYVATALYNLGETWREIGDLQTAVDHLTTANSLFQELDSPFQAARALAQLALAEAQQGHTADALGHAQESRQTCEASGAEGYVAVCDQVAGEIHAHSGDHAHGLALLESAGRRFASLGMTISALSCHVSGAASRLELGEWDSAEALFRESFAQAQVSLPDIAWRCAAGLAQIAENQDRTEQALAWHRQAANSIAEARRGLRHETLVDSFLAGRRSTALRRAMEAAVSANRIELALSFAETARAQVLTARLAFPSASTPSHNEEMLALRRDITELRHRLSADFESQPSLVRRFLPDQQVLLEKLGHKSRAYQQLAALHSGGDDHFLSPVHLESLRHRLSAVAPDGWACLVYHWLGDRLLTFLVGNDSLELHELNLGPMEQLALDLCVAPEPDRRRVMYGANNRAGSIHLKRLHDCLLPVSLQRDLSPRRLLVIAPGGRLHGLPFHALTDGAKYLCQRAVVSYAPSLTALDFSLARAAKLSPRPQSLLAVAVEQFGDSVPPLPHANDEAKLAAQSFKNSELLCNSSATPETVIAKLSGGYDALHFATHGLFDAQFGRLSRLLLHGGDLQADEIEQLSLSARLAMLTACHTAAGQTHAGEEVTGLTQAFLAAGAASVVSSMWSVDDEKSPQIANDFYGRLTTKQLSPAFALAETQRKWIADGCPPLDWASFAVYGAP
jgi:tetratricopeptide (TPR) repeat protein